MEFAFTDEQTALRDLAAKILDHHATHERLRTLEQRGAWFDEVCWQALAQASVLGLAIPEAHGGSGLGLIELGIVFEQIGRTVAPIPAWATLVLGALPLAAFGSAAQQAAWLPGVARGEVILTAALIETPLEDPFAPATTARRDGAGWRLDGVKVAVPAGTIAQRIFVPARTGDDAVGLFLVDPQAPGVTIDEQIATSREPQARLALAGVIVGNDAVLGDPMGGRAILEWLVPRAIATLCAVQIGVTERALRLTATYTSERKQFGRPLASFQAVQQRAADAWIDVEAIRLTAWQALWRLAEGLPAAAEVAVAKMWASEGGHRVTYAAQHLHGGMGVDVDYPVHRHYIWSKAIELTLGSAARHTAQLGAMMAAGSVAR